MKWGKKKKAYPHPLGSLHTPTQTVDIETDASFAGIVNTNLVTFLWREHGVVSEKFDLDNQSRSYLSTEAACPADIESGKRSLISVLGRCGDSSKTWTHQHPPFPAE